MKIKNKTDGELSEIKLDKTEKLTGKKSNDYFVSLTNLALYYSYIGENKKSLNLMQEVPVTSNILSLAASSSI